MRQTLFALVDCNNFFVSCERVFRPDLWDVPVAVLSNNDGCIVARSEEVKALGITMATPLFEVKDMVKKAGVRLFSANFKLYGDFSQRVVQLLQEASPAVEVYSVDESFLDISHLAVDDLYAWACELRAKIFKEIGIPVSIGIAQTKTLAKAASEFAKKNHLEQGVYDASKDVEALLRWLPIRDVWGIGYRTAPMLEQRGVTSAYDLTKVSEAWIRRVLTIRGLRTVKELKGESCIEFLMETAAQKSIARTRSFGHTVRNYYLLESAIATFAAQAAVRLRQQREVAQAITVFLRTPSSFEGGKGGSYTTVLPQATANSGELIAAAVQGLGRVYDPDFVYKKGGVLLHDLRPASSLQLTFDANPEQIDRHNRLMQEVDHLNARYGIRAIRYASEHPRNQGWVSRHESRSPAYTTNWQELPRVSARV